MKSGDFGYQIPPDLIAEDNRVRAEDLERDYDALKDGLRRSGLLSRLASDLDAVVEQVSRLELAVGSWAVGTGGTRFGRFPLAGEPETVFDKLVDVATVQRISGATPRISLHIPWDRASDPRELAQYARRLGLGFDAVNSNTFQDQPGQPLSYKFGSLSHGDPAVRAQAVEHNLECVELGKALGSDALSIWIGDGGSFPGQLHFRRSLARAAESLGQIYRALPEEWRLFLEHKPFEPAFYSTVIQDWGTSYVLARELGVRASCLVDLGHHLPNTNVEMVVARLISLGKMGGLHLNDSQYADDDLTAGSIHPYRLFLILCELVDAETDPDVDKRSFRPAYLIDQSHNLKDPIEELAQTAEAIWTAHAKALLVDRATLADLQDRNDVLQAELLLKQAFETDVRPIVRSARVKRGAAIDPIAVYRRARYREEKARERRGSGRPAGGLA
jgi:L-rhamnose isomerase/sugar isomerase